MVGTANNRRGIWGQLSATGKRVGLVQPKATVWRVDTELIEIPIFASEIRASQMPLSLTLVIGWLSSCQLLKLPTTVT